MHLDKQALRFAQETFEAFDEATLTFVPTSVSGRVSLVDRFQSIYNKPLRRRSLNHSPDVVFPDSLTIRSKITGEVYLIGQRRGDARPDLGHYHDLTVLHLVTDEGENSSAGLATLHRKVPKGPPDDPGWLEEEVVGHHYVDLEFRTSSDETDAYDISIMGFTAHFHKNAELQRQDFVELHGRFFRVVDHYPDSGFYLARMDEEPDTRVNLVAHRQDVQRYDQDLMRYVTDTVSYNVTGEVVTNYDIGEWASESQSYVDVVIDRNHIGFTPEAGLVIELDGRQRTVRRVSTQAGEKQYRLRCY